MSMQLSLKRHLRAIHKCQHFHECTNHTLSGGGGSVKINIFSVHFELFGLIFIIFMGIFGTQKMLMCALFWREGVSESVWFVLMEILMDGPLAVHVLSN